MMPNHLWSEDSKISKRKLCKICINCRIKDNQVHCRCGYFGNMDPDDIHIFAPHDYDCYEFED